MVEDGTPIAEPNGRRRCLTFRETPVGIEPTSTGLQPVAWPSGSSVKYPRQESNLIPDLRRVVCDPPHPEDIPRRGIEPRPAVSKTAVRSATLAGVRSPGRPVAQYPDLESNQDLDLRRVQCHPLHHRDNQEPTAGFAPA